MKISSISKSSSTSYRAKIRFNSEALEQMSKTKTKELEKQCKKIGHPQDIILIASKSIDTENLPGICSGILKTYVNAVSYKIKGEHGLAFLKNTKENLVNKEGKGYSNLAENIS